ncbi:MAG: hypothetical protein IJG36_04325 [Synergistaceae bacterium]|nr:hypothetical protein [Synergistaceae bacterium]MBR0279204.1 hypothetical protein [Synergistaceae bacterium]
MKGKRVLPEPRALQRIAMTLIQLNVAPSRAANGDFRNHAPTQPTARYIERDYHIRDSPHEWGGAYLRTDDIIAPDASDTYTSSRRQ